MRSWLTTDLKTLPSFREASLYLRFIKFRIPFGEVVLGQKFVRLVHVSMNCHEQSTSDAAAK